MKQKSVILVLCIIPFLYNSTLFAQSFDIGQRAGFFLEDADLYFGVEADVEPLPAAGLHIIPSIDKIFTDEAPGNVKLDSKWFLGLNAVYDWLPLQLGTVYAGGGLGFFRKKIKEDNTKETDISVNVIGGLRFDIIKNYKPFANVRLILSGSDTSISIEGGLHFSIF
ncbi:hypothetical protein AMJ80_01325 [bacterium SM23_31]|nr:MAG: hypothetical protein AMJ80_01325 [bacterium SM23_31]